MDKETILMDRALAKKIVAARPEGISEGNLHLKLLEAFDDVSSTESGYSVCYRGIPIKFEKQNLAFLEHPQVLHQWLAEYSPDTIVYLDVSDAREDLELYDEWYEDGHPLKETMLSQPDNVYTAIDMLNILFTQDDLERFLIVIRLGREGGALVGQFVVNHSD